MYFRSLCLLILMSCSFNSFGQKEVDINALVKELLLNEGDGEGIRVAWWLSDEFWSASIKSNPAFADDPIADEFLGIFAEYNLLAVVIGDMNSYGRITFASAEGLRNTISLTGQDGVEYSPIPQDDLSMEVQTTLDIFEPIFTQMLGEFGANLRIFAFDKNGEDGKPTLDPLKDVDFSLSAAGNTFTWDMPLASLLPNKKCPEDGEEMNGKWNYCPMHGDELEVVSE